ncbi:hypothetical protein BDN70DRAFT_939501 [Pholiota conissans]|uniref:Chromatin elongation factor SPT5 n=1 Tax=Pholiota conissans TaxID=109636 RepID=A0A9P5YKC7_9AGAR|nr:hypothetical protein BDN70DRAFT_939501 [Pholiota conissans]
MEDDEEEEWELQEQFIDDVEVTDDESSVVHNTGHPSKERILDEFFEGILTRAAKNRIPRASYTQDKYGRYRADVDEPIDYARIGGDKCKLWRVTCQIGSEINVVLALFDTAQEKHQLRSAFTRDAIRGCVYLECDMNNALLSLLERTVGIRRNRQGISRKRIQLEDSLDLLRMNPIKDSVKAGEWIEIKRRIYKGDVGMASAIWSWGVEVLLIPQVLYEPLNPKRKMTLAKPTAKLFDPKEYEVAFPGNLRRLANGSYSLGSLKITAGLLLKTYDHHSISSRVSSIPWSSFSMFALCGHPNIKVNHLPRPREWCFEEGDQIMVLSTGRKAQILSVRSDYVEVNFGEEGMHNIAWRDIRKDWTVGDLVLVKSGNFAGYKGWIVDLNEETATILEKMDKKIDIDSVQAHVNCLARTENAFLFSSEAPDVISKTPSFRLNRHRWCGCEVIISKPGHPRKGERAEIADVLLGQKTSSGMCLQLRMLQYDPASQYGRVKVVVDSEDVINALTLLLLKDDDTPKMASVHLQQATSSFNSECDGSSTPLSNEFSSTPAWDPSSTTPLDNLSWQSHAWNGFEKADASSHLSQASQQPSDQTVMASSSIPRHYLLDVALANAKLTAAVNGGGHNIKELTILFELIGGQISLRYIKHNTKHILQPEWITPKQPSATQHNGLLIVIKGEHRGKYARRITHDNTSTGPVIVLAAVVPEEGKADVLTGEQFRLSTEFLGIPVESKESKALNKHVMDSLRAPFLKKRH